MPRNAASVAYFYSKVGNLCFLTYAYLLLTNLELLFRVWNVESLEATPVYVTWEELTFQGLEQDCSIIVYVMDHVGPSSRKFQFTLVLFGAVE